MSALQLMVPVFLIRQCFRNLVPGGRCVPSGRFSSTKAAPKVGSTGALGRVGSLGETRAQPLLGGFSPGPMSWLRLWDAPRVPEVPGKCPPLLLSQHLHARD